jgi:hypothetical protein
MPSAVIMKAMAVWLRRSMRRSERRPYQIMLMAPTANGTAETDRICMLVRPNALTICGRKWKKS